MLAGGGELEGGQWMWGLTAECVQDFLADEGGLGFHGGDGCTALCM